MGDLSNNFSRYEFACHCGCGFDNIDELLVHYLQTIRNQLGHSVKILSGCRCKQHNENVGGEKNSAHLRGKAADVVCQTSKDRFDIISMAMILGINRIGIYRDFLHLDVDTTLPRPVIWYG